MRHELGVEGRGLVWRKAAQRAGHGAFMAPLSPTPPLQAPGGPKARQRAERKRRR